MAILWAGTEDLDFQQGTPAVASLDFGTYDSDYVRESVAISNLGNPTQSDVFPGGPVLTAWLTGKYYLSTLYGYTHPGWPILGLGYHGANVSLGLGSGGIKDGSGDSQRAALLFYNTLYGPVSIAEESGHSLIVNRLQRLDMQIFDWGGGLAQAKLWIDRVQVLDVSLVGVTGITGAPTGFDCVVAGPHQLAFGFQGLKISQVIVAESDTRLMELNTQTENTFGDTDDWAGSYTDVNELVIDDATTIRTNTDAKDEQFRLSTPVPGDYQIVARRIVARSSRVDGSSVTKENLGWHAPGGSTAFGGSPQTVIPSWDLIGRIDEVNPLTGLPWTQAELLSIQLNVRSAT